MKLIRLGAIILGMSLSAATHAAAPSAIEEVSAKVPYADLDLQHPEGAKALYRRIEQASARACKLGSYRELGSLQMHRSSVACFEDLVDKFVAKIDSPELSKIHEG
jgi:UrcA family protein